MILAPLTAAALVISVATAPMIDPQSAVPMSAQQKSAAVQPLLRSTTECIARTVAADPRFRQPGSDLGDLIVDSTPMTNISARARARPSSWAPISTSCRRR